MVHLSPPIRGSATVWLVRATRAFALALVTASLVSCVKTGVRDDEIENTPVTINTGNMRDVRPRCRIERGTTLTPRVLCNAVLQTPNGDRGILGFEPGVSLSWSSYEHLVGQSPQSATCTPRDRNLFLDCDLKLASTETSVGRLLLTATDVKSGPAPAQEARVQLPYYAASFGYNPVARAAAGTAERARSARAATNGTQAAGALALAPIPVSAEQFQVDHQHGRSSALCELDHGSGPVLYYSSARAIYRITPDAAGTSATVTHFAGGKFRQRNGAQRISSPFDVGIEGGAVLVCDRARKLLHAFYSDSFHPGTVWHAAFAGDGTAVTTTLPDDTVRGEILSAGALGPDGKIYLLQQPPAPTVESDRALQDLHQAGTIVGYDPERRTVTRTLRLPTPESPHYCIDLSSLLRPNSIECSATAPWGGLAVAADGAFIVSDTGRSRVLRIDPANSGATTLIGANQTISVGQRKLNHPAGVIVGPDGSLFVADSLNYAVVGRSPSGTLAVALGNTGDKDSTVPSPRNKLYPATHTHPGAVTSLAMAADGTVWAAGRTVTGDQGGADLLVLTRFRPGGQASVLMDGYFSGFMDGEILQPPAGIARPRFEAIPAMLYHQGSALLLHREPGALLAIDRASSPPKLRVLAGSLEPASDTAPHWNATGGTTGASPRKVNLRSAQAMAVGPEGDIYLATRKRLFRLSRGMLFELGSLAAGEASISAIAVDAQGAVYVVDSAHPNIRRLARGPDGRYADGLETWLGTRVRGPSIELPEGVQEAGAIVLPLTSGAVWHGNSLYLAVTAPDHTDSRIYRVTARANSQAVIEHVAGRAVLNLGNQEVPGPLDKLAPTSVPLKGTLHLGTDGDFLIVADLRAGAVYRMGPLSNRAEMSAETLFHAATSNAICASGTVPIANLGNGGGGALMAAVANLCPGMPLAAASVSRCSGTDPHREFLISNLFDQYSTVTLVRAPCEGR